MATGEVQEEIAFQPAVVQPAFFIRAAAKGALKSGIGGEGAQPPAGVAPDKQAQLAVQGARALAIAQAFAIGRVEQEHPGGAFQRERLEVLAVYADATLQPCLADMPSAQRKRFGVNVAAGDG